MFKRFFLLFLACAQHGHWDIPRARIRRTGNNPPGETGSKLILIVVVLVRLEIDGYSAWAGDAAGTSLEKSRRGKEFRADLSGDRETELP